MTAPQLTDQQTLDLHRIQVRLALPEERKHWDTLMRGHHYRGFRTLAGCSLRYVATVDERW